MLNPAKASRSALINAAESYIGRQKYAEAETLIAGVLAKDPEDAEALGMMAEALLFQGRPDIRYYMRAVWLLYACRLRCTRQSCLQRKIYSALLAAEGAIF